MSIPVVGGTKVAVMHFIDRSNIYRDPTFIRFFYRTPVTNQLVEVDYPPATSSFRHVGTGIFELDIPCNEPGSYKCRYESDYGNMEGEFTVVRSEVK